MPVSQGLKAGLAAGVIYGVMVGMLHFGTLEACRDTQIQYIQSQLILQNPPTNATAQDLFATDLIYFPMVYGIWGLVYGVIYGAVFALVYLRLPGSSSKRKAMILVAPIFVIGIIAGPAFFAYQCNPGYIPYVALGAGLPVSAAFGYVLGVFYDSFGRLRKEEEEEALKRDGKK
ncbi:MAG: hypothetical protein ACRDF4_11600 [Rhabdochlamydiaceae bacterium]